MIAQEKFLEYGRSGIELFEIPCRNQYPVSFPGYGNFSGYRNFPGCGKFQGFRRSILHTVYFKIIGLLK